MRLPVTATLTGAPTSPATSILDNLRQYGIMRSGQEWRSDPTSQAIRNPPPSMPFEHVIASRETRR